MQENLENSYLVTALVAHSIKSFFVLHQAPFGNFSFSVQRITSLMSIEATENERVEYVCIFGAAPIALFLQSLHRACAF